MLVSTEPATLQSTEEALRELQTAFDLYRQSKKPKEVTEHAAENGPNSLR
jgi:hypothetical protein